MSYITSADITDSIKAGFDLTALIAKADLELVALARSQNVIQSQIAATPDYIVKEWLISWVIKELCLEKIGKANDVDRDKYQNKYELYLVREGHYRSRITEDMIRGIAYTQLQTVPRSGQMVRA
jgi:hypothetical protein